MSFKYLTLAKRDKFPHIISFLANFPFVDSQSKLESDKQRSYSKQEKIIQ